nr:putative ribonuclease H-like domain-containing protein [Tanacetum cinerariifolium]
MTDYSLWEVILNGDAPLPTRVIEGVVQPLDPTTAEQRLARKNELKARGTLLMALPDKHQLKFNTHKDAKTLMEATEKRFSGNKETKKVQKTLLKQQFENFTGLSFESLDQIHDRLQKLIISDVASVSAASAKVSVSALPNVDTLSDTVIYSFFASQSNSSQLDNDDLEQIDTDDLEEIDLKWEMAMWSATTATGEGTFPGSAGSYDWSFQAEEEPTNYVLMAFTSSSSLSSDNEVASCSKTCTKAYATLQSYYASQTNDKTGLGYDTQAFTSFVFDCDEMLSSESDASLPASPLYERSSAFIIEDWVSDSEDESEAEPAPTFPSFVQPIEHVKTPRSSVKTVEHPILAETHRNDSPKSRNIMNRKACFVLLTKSRLVPLTAARLVTAAVPKPQVTRPRLMKNVVNKSYLPPRRTINRRPYPKPSTFPQKVTTANSPQGSPQHALQDKGVIDSGCSRHITGNMSYLSDFESINGGYVAFGGNPKGGKITGKGKIRLGKLEFDDVYFVKELKFNLFSILQMCDKKNIVLFTNTECIILSSDFKLPDKSHVLLRVHRENNMYNVDLKNIVPSGDLTCLFANTTLDESNLWHRRLGHINFKTMNKLVKGNLVRGLPSKVFENKQTCVACKKGKQHRTSCKNKPVSFVSQPLQRLHMDLFEPTFVKSLNKKSYYLVVTDDYSRFSWVFFLTTKDETSPILKTFITGIENQLSLKAKIIRSDNGTEFKNHDLNQFCGMKGIKREFSVARTPQQNGIAKKKNMTLIEAARTMLTDLLLSIPFWAEENEFKVEKPESQVHVSLSSSAKTKKHDDKTKREAKGKNMPALEDITYSVDEENVGAKFNFTNLETTITVSPIPTTRVHRDHPEELLQLKMQKVWVLVNLPKGKKAIGHTQEEGIDYEEVFAPVAKIEAIRLFLAYASFMGFTVYQIDVKSDFLYGTIKEEVYVCQPSRFEDPDYPNKGSLDCNGFKVFMLCDLDHEP